MPVFIDGFLVDVTPTQEHAERYTVTSHPLESGANAADHIIREPIVLRMTGIISDTPMGAAELARQQDSPGGVPSQDAHAHLKSLGGTVFTVETDLETYPNMTLAELTEPVTASDGKSLRFRVTFRQLDFIESGRSVVAVPRAKRKVNRGNKATKTTPDKATAPPQKIRDNGSIVIRRWRQKAGNFAQTGVLQ